MPEAVFRVKGAEELRYALRNPRLVGAPLEELLREAAAIGKRVATQTISGGTGLAEQSIGSAVSMRALTARVYTRIAEPTAMSIERGRSGGSTPSLAAVARWLKGTPYGVPVLSRAERSQAARIQAAIRQHGSRGKGFLAAALRAVESELPRLERRALDQLQGVFRE